MTVLVEQKIVPVPQPPVEQECVVLTLDASTASRIRFCLYSAEENKALSQAEIDACTAVYNALVDVSTPSL